LTLRSRNLLGDFRAYDQFDGDAEEKSAVYHFDRAREYETEARHTHTSTAPATLTIS